MHLNKKIVSIAVGCALMTGIVISGFWYQKQQKTREVMNTAAEEKELTIWYEDDSLTNFLKESALAYENSNHLKVKLVLATGIEYLEEINKATVHDNNGPDVYIASNDVLERATLAGLSAPVSDAAKHLTTSYYPQTALDAVTYKNKQVAYPLYFETAFMVYNETYLTDYAKQTLEAANADTGTEITDDMIKQQMQSSIPVTIDQLLTFADGYDAPSQVENVFKWDVSDVMFDYPFAGNYLKLGGQNGDDSSIIDFNNQQAVDCLTAYQQLNQFFAIDPKLVTYDSVIDEFIQGKTVYTLATTDIIKKLEEAKANGTFTYSYGTGHIPNPSESYASKSMSITNAVVVNGYSKNIEEAHKLAAYLSFDCASLLYAQSGKITARSDIACEVAQIANVKNEYASSAPIPKLMDSSNYWIQLENMFYNIWTGNDIQTELTALSDTMQNQLGSKSGN